MDGLSGIKIYNKLHVDTRFLPKAYGDALDLIVTGVSHKLQKNDWETDIEATVIPKTSGATAYTPTSTTQQSVSAPGGAPLPRSVNCPVINFKTNDSSKRVSINKVLSISKNIFPELSKKALSGMLGHFRYEGQFNPTAFNNTGGGCGALGIAQWRGNRQKNLESFAKSQGTGIEDITTQLKFIKKELTESYKNVWNLLKSDTLTLRQYTAVVHISFGLGNSNPYGYYFSIVDESSYITIYKGKGGNTPSTIPKRYKYAEEFLNLS
jgi:hypothetical protein